MTSTPLRLLSACLLLSLVGTAPVAAAPEPASPAGVAFFEKKIRPVLTEHCSPCHSQEAQKNKKLRGGLLLDSRKGLLDGGDSGPAVVPGKPGESLLLKTLL